MNLKKIIREELKKVFEADYYSHSYYDRFPDFLDPLYNPQIGTFPPIGKHSFGTMVKEEDDLTFDLEKLKKIKDFKSKVEYCERNLQKTSSNPNEFSYRMGDNKILKLKLK